MSPRLFLVDGMSHLYRAYYAIQGLTNSKGIPTNAVFGFTNMLRKLIQEEAPSHLGVAVDLGGPTVRHERYPEYKATRKPMPEDLAEQVPLLGEVCRVLRVPILSLPRYEADDVIGTLAARAAERGLEVVIVTIDKDMFQLVDDRIRVLDTRTMTLFGPEEVEAKTGVPPERVVDVLSLVGDSSDNIPGAPGIGEKGARALIREFGTLDALLANTERVSRKTYRESLRQNRDRILQSRELLRIHTDLSLELDLEALKVTEPDVKAAQALFAELDFQSLLEEFLPRSEVRPRGEQTTTVVEDLKDLKAGVRDQRVALALSSVPGGGGKDSPSPCLGLAAEGGLRGFLSASVLGRNGEQVTSLLRSARHRVVHDFKRLHFEARRGGWRVEGRWDDTMLMAYLLAPNRNDFTLERLAAEHLQTRLPQGEEEAGVLSGLAEAVLLLHGKLEPEIRKWGLESLLNEIEMPLVEVLVEMESVGVKVDVDFLAAMSGELEVRIAGLVSRIYELAGEEFNLNSPKQLSGVLFEGLGLPVPRRTRKAGHYATGVEVLEELSGEHEIARLILEYRELSKLKSTYLDALPRLVHPETGRIHTSFNQMVAATGRLSSSNPNLQNIPVKTEVGRRIRKGFVAEEGFSILAADYSQIELRVMAHLSGDEVLIDAFRKGEDIHERTAREVFGMNAAMSPQEFRRAAKAINFGVLYGQTAFGLARSLGIERREAQRFIDEYFARHRGVRRWLEETEEEAARLGYVTTLFGRIRPIPEIRSKNPNLRGFGVRTAVNAPIQGTAADLIKKAMVGLHQELKREGLKSRLILQVHDELVLEVAEQEVEAAMELVREAMEGAAELAVPLKVDLAVGPNWYEAKS